MMNYPGKRLGHHSSDQRDLAMQISCLYIYRYGIRLLVCVYEYCADMQVSYVYIHVDLYIYCTIVHM